MPRQRLVLVTDVAVGNDKIITVPAGPAYEFLYGRMVYTATATVGTRVPTIELRDSANNVLWSNEDATGPTASQVETYNTPTDFPMPVNPILLGGFDLRAYDSADVDVLDTIALRFMFVKGPVQS